VTGRKPSMKTKNQNKQTTKGNTREAFPLNWPRHARFFALCGGRDCNAARRPVVGMVTCVTRSAVDHSPLSSLSLFYFVHRSARRVRLPRSVKKTVILQSTRVTQYLEFTGFHRRNSGNACISLRSTV
jgi:hypothetical protein